MIVEYDCTVCGTHVRKRRSPANVKAPPKYCSQRCNGLARKGTGAGTRPNLEYQCENCGVIVSTYRGKAAQEKGQARFCSVKCTGEAQKGRGNPAYTGGRHILKTGYTVVLMPEHPMADSRGYVLEHRAVMERKLGRPLAPGEIVHHINGIKTDNRPENLGLFASQSEHMRHHAAEQWEGRKTNGRA